jgi:hypothetical protein
MNDQVEDGDDAKNAEKPVPEMRHPSSAISTVTAHFSKSEVISLFMAGLGSKKTASNKKRIKRRCYGRLSFSAVPGPFA